MKFIPTQRGEFISLQHVLRFEFLGEKNLDRPTAIAHHIDGRGYYLSAVVRDMDTLHDFVAKQALTLGGECIG